MSEHRRTSPGQTALPPQLRVRPKDHQAVRTPPDESNTVSDNLIVALLVAGFAVYVGQWIGSHVARAVDSEWSLLAGAPIWLLGAVAVVRMLTEQLRFELPRARARALARRGHDAEILRAVESVDPKRIITAEQIPAHAQTRFRQLVTLANHASDDELDEALTRLYTEATRMRAGQWRDPLEGVLAPVTAEEEQPLDPAIASRLNVAGHRQEQWRRARASHDAVRLEWTEILVDRFAVLEKPQLLDVSQPATAAFITAYARVQDFRAIHGEDFDADLVDDYVSLSGEAASAWVEAKARAEEAGLSHLAEQDRARFTEAMHLLDRADDEELPVRQRVRATTRAARLLGKVESMELPADFLP